jgi:glutamyl-tRNA reductase
MQEVAHVEAIIAEEVAAFDRWLRSLSVVHTISDLRYHAEVLRQQELTRTMRQLAPTLSEREAAAVQELTTRLLNKLLHTPTLRLKEAATAGQGHVYAEALRYLFDLEEHTNEAYNDRNESQHISDGSNPVGDRAVATVLADVGNNHRTDSHHR